MTSAMILTALVAFLIGRASKGRPRTGYWMHTKFSRDFSGYPLLKRWDADITRRVR
jgi:hypothetical protein